jgi:hypothetical protein
MWRFRLVLCLICFPAALVFLGGAAAVDAHARVEVGIVAGVLAGVFFGLVFGGVRGKWLDKVFGPEVEDDSTGAGPFPSSDESYVRLHASGWSIGDARFLTRDGLRWRVLGSNGENVIDATGVTQSEAWHRAVEQAQSLGMLGRAACNQR